MKKQWLMISVLLLVLATVLGCGGKTKEEVMAEVKAKASAFDSYQADMAMDMEMMGQKMKFQGNMVFKKPNKSHMETVMDMGAMKMKQVIISNGKITWTYQPDMKMVTKIDLGKVPHGGMAGGPQQSNDISKPFQGFQEESISYLGTKKLDGIKTYVFQGSFTEDIQKVIPFAPDKIEMWVGVEDGLLRKMVMFSKENKEMMSMVYTNIETNIETSDDLFEFTPPEGIQVMDMTEGAINMMKNAQEGKK